MQPNQDGQHSAIRHRNLRSLPWQKKLCVCLMFNFHTYLLLDFASQPNRFFFLFYFLKATKKHICECVRFFISFPSTSIFSLRSGQIIPPRIKMRTWMAMNVLPARMWYGNEVVKKKCWIVFLALNPINLMHLLLANKYSFSFFFSMASILFRWMRNFKSD